MNILLWVLQILLALHTAVGAIWKFSNPAQTVPSLEAIPHGVWLAMGVVELLCSLGLIIPVVSKRLGVLAPAAAIYIVAEMLLYCGLNIFSVNPDYNHVIYWLVVAAFSGFIAWGRLKLRPVK